MGEFRRVMGAADSRSARARELVCCVGEVVNALLNDLQVALPAGVGGVGGGQPGADVQAGLAGGAGG